MEAGELGQERDRMKNWIQLHYPNDLSSQIKSFSDDDAIWVNLDNVYYIRRRSDGTSIVAFSANPYDDDNYIVVMESVLEIFQSRI